jgi:hypothetical protein
MQVYRCYDNRLRCTERRPDVYENWSGIRDHCKVVLHIEDIPTTPSTSHPFGQLAPESYTNKYKKKPAIADFDWLWNFKGQLKVIETKYHEGMHYATKPKQLLPIVDFLESMHKDNYVHGDIRAYNMVLNYEDDKKPEGWLIDFDFGGRIDTNEPPKYPTGYKNSLDDGFRLGEPGDSITCDHDLYALGQIIFSICYSLNHHDRESVSNEVRLELLDSPYTFKAMNGDYSQLEGGAAKFLRDYLCTASEYGFELTLEDRFQKSLKDCNLLQVPNSPRIDSQGATGSPEKKKE